MNFAVIGAGAVGMLTASLLKEAGCSVQLITRRPEQAEKINANGIKRDGEVHFVEASSEWDRIPPNAFILVAVKYSHLPDIIKKLKSCCLDNPLVFMQNGMMHIELIRNLPQQNIAAGIVEHGALKISETEVRHTGKGIFKFALLSGDEKRFLPLLNINGVKAEWHKDADQMLFRKVLLNTMINPLTALLSLKNGELLSNPHAYELLKNVYTELYSAFPEIETLLPFEQVTALCASTAENTSSMLADKLAGRQLEVDTILLYTIRRSPYALPILQTFYHLLKAAEKE
ncbi:ketopantoate reductase family protein [Planococcus halotolerans]|uniref:2-dehydropantoate 2-reductase n=1 Tax=Planococcus halotolerans TaxID=2233542 RepID=A0A365L1Q7_9BACL|nr:2-dehydropantoate 2-reductase [Planococcus halotolerans]QHJ70878.1 2-dehydropantoate 2-reductase [Planococcus halotolerans]RAZ79368.1 2-dehydropantoate 2-reductase [Planococcus halotolerans]